VISTIWASVKSTFTKLRYRFHLHDTSERRNVTQRTREVIVIAT
jgi:hypothetical protein